MQDDHYKCVMDMAMIAWHKWKVGKTLRDHRIQNVDWFLKKSYNALNKKYAQNINSADFRVKYILRLGINTNFRIQFVFTSSRFNYISIPK